MPIDELGTAITDTVEAQLVECVPPPDEAPHLLVSVDVTPTAQAQDATIEQTGAGPPPKGAE